MHTIVFILAAAITAALAANAAAAGIIRSLIWLSASVVPMFLLYLGFRNEPNPMWYLWPVYLLALIVLAKQFARMRQALPAGRAVAAPVQDHWAVR
jgi:hypothetical protein